MRSAEQVYGLHAVAALLASRPAAIKKLMVADVAADRQLAPLLEQAAAAGIAIQKVSRRELDQQVPGARHQGILAVVRETSRGMSERQLPEFLAALTEPAFLLVLDGVQDPHNLGACMRTADAAGVDAVIVPRHGAAGLGPTVSKVAAGAAEQLPFAPVGNVGKVLAWLGDYGVRCVGTSDRADSSLYDADLSGSVALDMGREHTGLGKGIASRCDTLVSLPMHGVVSSLNVSVATGICLYEIARQRSL